jgi:hypothetical protein
MLGSHVPPVLKARIVEIAARNGHTVSSYVRRLIARDVVVADVTGDLG